MLEVKGLSIDFQGEKVLDKLDLTVNSGEICAIIGPSGCGKSTLLKAVAGLIERFQGDILFENESISPKKQTIAFIPQNYGLLPWQTVEQNILLALKLKGRTMTKLEMHETMDSVLNKLGLLQFKKRYPANLSGGQKQRVAIARAFILHADILLMDEPFSALDSLTTEAVLAFFSELWESQKTTTLFVTHDIEEAVFLGTNIVLMNAKGKILQVMDNQENQVEKQRTSLPFIKRCKEIRDLMKKEWTAID